MKEQILHLDPHDDYVSARDKMGWVQTARVVLVWPPHGQVLNRRLDLVLLHRHAHRLGAQMALVSGDAKVREHASDIGLPVFGSVEATRKMRWRSRVPRVRPFRRQPRPNTDVIRTTFFAQQQAAPSGRWFTALRIALFTLGLAAVLFLAYSLIPSATVTLTPAAQPISATVNITADENAIVSPDAPLGLIPARTIRVEVQNTQVTATTGQIEVPDQPAVGKVVFTNLVGTAAFIPQGTSVRTITGTNVRFVTRTAANIEGRIGATIEVEIEAVERGSVGNVNATTINGIDGPLGTQLAVTNPLPTSGGSVQQRSAVAPQDRERLRAQMLNDLQLNAVSAVEAQLQPGEFLVSQTLTITQVLAESFDRAVGEPTDALSLTLRIAATGLAVNELEARQAAAKALQAQIPAQATLAAESLQFVRDPQITLDEAGRAQFTLTASGNIFEAFDAEAVRQLVRGQSVTSASALLQNNFKLATPPQIGLSPDWLAGWYAYLPWLPLRIEIITP